MTLADITRNVRAWAIENRLQVHPAQGSLPHKMYLYWRRHSTKEVAHENLCHFVRVLIFWAPAFWLRSVFLVGPQVGRVKVSVIPTLLSVAALGFTAYQWVTGFVVGVLVSAGAAWVIVGTIAFVAMAQQIIASEAETLREIRHTAANALRYDKRARVAFWISPLVPVTLLSVTVSLIALLYFVLVVPFDHLKIHRRIGRGIKWFLTVHPRGAKWLTPAWLGLVPAGYLLWTSPLARLLALVSTVAALIVVAAITAITRTSDRRRAAKKRAAIDAERRKNLQLERTRDRWRSLAGSEIFRLWLWKSDDHWADFMRMEFLDRLTADDLPHTFVLRAGDYNMARAENLFLLWIMGLSEICHDCDAVASAPRPPHRAAGIAAKAIWPLYKAAAGMWWLLRGIGQLAMLVVTALWAAKIAKLCPLVKFTPAPRTRVTDDFVAM